MGMFDFMGNMEPYEDRLVNRSDFDWGFISTVAVSDGRKPFETAIQHIDFNDGDMVIVACYDTKKQAEKGHDKWIKEMENHPKEVIDIENYEIQQHLGKETFKKKEN